MLCDLHINGKISTDVVKEASKNFTSPEPISQQQPQETR